LVHGTPAGGPRFSIETPCGHRRLERHLEGWDEGLKLVNGHAGDIQKRCGAGLQVSEPYTGQRGASFPWRHKIPSIGISSPIDNLQVVTA
jgi:hypothetical protein